MKALRYFILILTTLISGCASLIDGTEQTLTFDSEPEHATVIVSGKRIGETPLTVPIKRDADLVLEITKEGYKTYKVKLNTKINTWVAGNILFGLYGVFSTTTDGATGGMTEFSENQYFVKLTPNDKYNTISSQSGKIKEYLISFGDSIKMELASNGGEKTNALINLIGSDDVKATTTALKKLSRTSKNNLDFAMKIIDFYDIK